MKSSRVLLTIQIDLLRQLKGLGRCKIGVSRRDSEDDRVRITYVPKAHFSDLDLDVVRLVADGNLCDAR